VPAQTGHFDVPAAVPIGNFTSKAPQRLQEYS
jgi:hypothetical protein